jgi:hypothetical protein
MDIQTLIGRTVACNDDSFNYGSYGDMKIEDVSTWMRDSMTRDYIKLGGSGARLVAKLFQPIQGKASCDFALDTPHGRICGLYGAYANSGAKRHAARAMVEALFA